jgi:hypothetical protein
MKFLKQLFSDEAWTPAQRLIYFYGASRSEAPRGDDDGPKESVEKVGQETREELGQLEEKIEYRALKRSEIEGKLLKQIAKENGMTEEELVTLNKAKSPKFRLGKTPKGSLYCNVGDTVYVKKPVPEAAKPAPVSRPETVAAQRTERAETRQAAAEERRETVAHQQEHQDDSYLARSRELVGMDKELPDFLRGGQLRTSDTEWSQMLTLGQQADNPQVGRLVDVVSQKPLELTPPTFRAMVRLGAPNRLSFEDISQTVTGESAQVFIEKYEGLLAKREKGDAKDPARLELAIQKREAVIVQAHKIFQALEELRGGELIHEEREATQVAAREDVLAVETIGASDLFDLDAALQGRLERSVRGEQKEYIGLNPQLVQGMKNHLQSMGLAPELANKADIGFSLQLLLACYGVDELISNGSISQKVQDGGETILYLQAIPGDFNENNPLAQAVVDSIRAQGGYLSFNRQTAGDMNLAQLEGEERTAAVVEAAFTSDHSTISWEEAETGGKMDFEDTRYATKNRDTEAMLADLLSYRSHFDSGTGQEVIEYDLLAEDLSFFLQEGIKGWANDPQLRDMGIIQELGRAGVSVKPKDKEELGRLDLGLRDLSENMDRIDRRITRVEGRIAKQPNNKEFKTQLARLQGEKVKEQKQIDDLNAKRAQILSSGDYINQLVQVLSVNPDNLSSLTSQQKMFIQNGYELHKGRRVKDRVQQQVAESLEAVIEGYSDKPTVQGVLRGLLRKIEQDGGEIEPNYLEAAARAIDNALTNRGFQFPALPDFPEPGQSAPSAAVAGSTESQGSDLTGGQLGAALSFPIKISKTETLNLTLTAGLGYTADGGSKGGIGIGLGKTWQIDDEVSIGINFGAAIAQDHVSSGGVGFGAAAVAAEQDGDFVHFQVASAGLALSPTNGVLPGASLTFGFRKKAETFAENARSVAEFKAGFGPIEDAGSNAEKARLIAELPELQHIVSGLEAGGFGEKTKQAFLIGAYEELKANLGDYTESQMPADGITGAQLTLIPVPPFIIPGLSFAFRGKTIMVFAVPNMNEVLADSGKTIESALREKVGDARIVEGIDTGDWEIAPLPTGYNLDGERIQIESRSQDVLSVRDLLGQSLDAQNAQVHKSGFHLEQGQGEAEGLLNLQVHGIRGNVEVTMDPAMKARLAAMPGPDGKATGEDLYLALNQLDADSNLFITRETFILPRKRNGSHTFTRITIRDNEDRSNKDILAEPHGVITFRNNSNAVTIAPRGNGESLTNVLGWQDMDESQERAEIFEELDMDGYIGELGRVSELSPRALTASPEAIDPDGRLTKLAQDIFQKDKKTWLAESIFDEDWTEGRKDLVEKLKTAAKGLIPAVKLSENQLNYMISVIRKETYVHSDRSSQAERDAYRERNRQFFEQVLSREFSPEVAETIMEDIQGNQTTRAIPPTAEIFTVVGREGVSGLRADTLPKDGEVLGYTDYSDDLQMRQEVLARLGTLPSNPEALMRTTLALNLYQVYAVIQGVEDYNLITAIYNDPSLLASSEPHAAAFREFQAIAQKLQANQASGSMIEITTDYGVTLELGIKTEVFGGTNSACDNPLIGLNQSMVIGGFQGMTESQIQTLLPKIRGKVSTPIYELFAAYSHKHTPEERTTRKSSGEEDESGGSGTGEEEEPVDGQDAPGDDEGAESSDTESSPDTGGGDVVGGDDPDSATTGTSNNGETDGGTQTSPGGTTASPRETGESYKAGTFQEAPIGGSSETKAQPAVDVSGATLEPATGIDVAGTSTNDSVPVGTFQEAPTGGSSETKAQPAVDVSGATLEPATSIDVAGTSTNDSIPVGTFQEAPTGGSAETKAQPAVDVSGATLEPVPSPEPTVDVQGSTFEEAPTPEPKNDTSGDITEAPPLNGSDTSTTVDTSGATIQDAPTETVAGDATDSSGTGIDINGATLEEKPAVATGEINPVAPTSTTETVKGSTTPKSVDSNPLGSTESAGTEAVLTATEEEEEKTE